MHHGTCCPLQFSRYGHGDLRDEYGFRQIIQEIIDIRNLTRLTLAHRDAEDVLRLGAEGYAYTGTWLRSNLAHEGALNKTTHNEEPHTK